jgi:hypothetical protein
MASLFKDFNPFEALGSNQKGFVGGGASRGDLIAFHYPNSLAKKRNIIHDPYPLVIITDVWPTVIRGINLHYLTFPYIKHVLNPNCGNSGFSYSNIKADKYIAGAFRMYYRQGVRQPRKMDCEWLLKLLGAVRRWSPDEIDKVKQDVRNQIQKRLQVKADELTAQDRYRLNQKAEQVRSTVQGGVDRNLMTPQQYGVGQNPANFQPPQGGDFSTDELQ